MEGLKIFSSQVNIHWKSEMKLIYSSRVNIAQVATVKTSTKP